MKKILVLFSLFLFSCGTSNLEIEKKAEDTTVLLDKNGTVLLDSEKVVLGDVNNSGTTITTSKENIKQICETAKVGDNFSSLEEKFGNAILLSETDLGENGKSITYSYYYGKLGEEMCMIIIKKGEIISKQYTNI